MITKVKEKLKKYYLITSGRVKHLQKKTDCMALWYGKKSCGFYIYPDVLNNKSIIYSFGIGEDISFDLEIIEKHSCTVFGFDPTPKSINWIKNQIITNSFYFNDFGLSNQSGFADFYLPKNPNFVSGSMVIQNNINVNEKVSVKMKTFDEIVKQLGHNKIDVLKLDIEGSEYIVIDDILCSGIQIGQILVEFHDRLIPNGKEKTIEFVNKMHAAGFNIFAVSDTFEEVSFIHKNLK